MKYKETLVILSSLAFLGSGYFWLQTDKAATETPSMVLPELVFGKDLLPDLVPLPARDLKLVKNGSTAQLLFSTSYYNQGRGSLELRADEVTRGIRDDINRDVLQRIYDVDGNFRDKVVGNFLWHQSHLHYHFADFVNYDLEPVEVSGAHDLSGIPGIHVKSTFCIRDVSRVDLELEYRATEAKYLICGKELQGISVGWGDTYFYDYPDQGLDVSSLPSGTYRLSFTVNPSNRFEESNFNNNRSSVIIEFNIEEGVVRVIREEPEDSPGVEHVYPEQVFGL
ncbi:MAG: hypothetical protein HYS89_01020 [Candidatus Colwellbacteria bacterium]|nr:hypothetical protein [Candidatus Colwellbacteria bacterium]